MTEGARSCPGWRIVSTALMLEATKQIAELDSALSITHANQESSPPP